MQALEPRYQLRKAPYRSVFHWYEDKTRYRPEWLTSWSDGELVVKHYHLTARLDGYNHLVGDPEIVEVTKHNVNIFRAALAERGIDGVRHCIKMDWLYDAGWREVKIFYPPLDKPQDA